jgi:hypothetical protein
MCCELCGHDSPIYKFVSFAIHDGDARPVCDSCFQKELRQGFQCWTLARLPSLEEFDYAEE